MWIAIKPFRYRDVSYAAGDQVPAERWPNRRAFEVTRRIRKVDAPVGASPSTEAVTAPPPNFSKMKRAGLNTYATTIGIEAADDNSVYPTREALISKIEQVLTPASESAGSEETKDGEGSESESEGEEDEEEDPFADLDEDN